MPLRLTRKQSMWLGFGLLASFFMASAITIYHRNQMRLPANDSTLTKEGIEGAAITTPDPLGTPATTPAAGGIGFVLNDFHRSLVRDGKTVWEIHGQRGKYDAVNSRAQIEKPDLHVVRDNGDPINLTADRADLTLAGNELSSAELHDNVVVVYKENTTVKASEAFYNQKEGKVNIPVPVELDNPMFWLKGNKLEALLDTQEITITKGVSSIIKPRKK